MRVGVVLPGVHHCGWPGPAAAAATAAVPEAATVHSQPSQPEEEGVGAEVQRISQFSRRIFALLLYLYRFVVLKSSELKS